MEHNATVTMDGQGINVHVPMEQLTLKHVSTVIVILMDRATATMTTHWGIGLGNIALNVVITILPKSHHAYNIVTQKLRAAPMLQGV